MSVLVWIIIAAVVVGAVGARYQFKFFAQLFRLNPPKRKKMR